MSHHYLVGTIYHKRFTPKVHDFVYPFFMIDIDTQALGSLQQRFFSYEHFNLLSFFSKDHFGAYDSFSDNVLELLQKFSLKPTEQMRFITLPRILNFVFNPISMLLLMEEDKPKTLLAEVHNYNGGNIVYCLPLKRLDNGRYHGSSEKEMYVSPFFERDGDYEFEIAYDADHFTCKITYFKNSQKMLTAALRTTKEPFNATTTKTILLHHIFLTFGVVGKTLWQSLRLKLKGLKWHSPTTLDQTRRY